jgi:HK97 family phage portal protein
MGALSIFLYEMGIKQRFAEWLMRDVNLDLKSTTGWKEMINSSMTDAGVAVKPEIALNYSAVNAAVRVRGETRASLPVMIYRKTKEGKEEFTDHPLYRMLAFQPNPWMNYFDFWYLSNSYVDLWGNAYHIIYKKRGDKYPSALIPIHPDSCKPKLVDGKIKYLIRGGKYEGEWNANQIIHFKGMSVDGIEGKSPIEMAAENIGLGMAAEKFGGKYFRRNGVLRAVIESAGTINDDAYSILKKRWSENADHDTAILDRGMTLKELGIAPNAAQFLETRGFQVTEIARFMNIPPAFLQDHSHSTFSNTEQMDLWLAKYTVRPILKRDENELESKLLLDEWPEVSIKWNLDAMLRADIKTRAEFYAKMIQHKVFNPNEARELEGRNPYVGGEVYENPNTNTNKDNNGQND